MAKSKSRKRMSSGSSDTAYCVKCKSKVTISNPSMSQTKNGQPMIRGKVSSMRLQSLPFRPKELMSKFRKHHSAVIYAHPQLFELSKNCTQSISNQP